MEKSVIDLYTEITKGMKPRDKEQAAKFMTTFAMADPESYKVVLSHGIQITKCGQVICLTQDPKTLTQALDLAEKMGFIDAYRENPKRLCQLVTNVIKRMAKCDAIGVSYKKESGQFENFIFSEREFNAYMATLGNEVTNVIDFPQNNAVEETNTEISLVKEYALKVLREYDIEDQKEAVFSRLDEIKDANLSTKEMLMEAFKIFPGDPTLLSNTIDSLLNNVVSLSPEAIEQELNRELSDENEENVLRRAS